MNKKIAVLLEESGNCYILVKVVYGNKEGGKLI
jgi:hypothetical protein